MTGQRGGKRPSARAKGRRASARKADEGGEAGPAKRLGRAPTSRPGARGPSSERPWRERRADVEALVEELRARPSSPRMRAIVEELLATAADSKWEVRLAVARAIAHVEHPDYASLAERLSGDDNSYVAKAAWASAQRRRELDLEYQSKSDEIDEVAAELAQLREAFGERAATAAERVAEHRYRLLTNETTHEMRTVVASLLDALAKLEGRLEASRTAKKHYERTLGIARERASFLQRMLEDTKRLVDEPKLEREDVAVDALLEEVADIVRGALDVGPAVRFEVEVGTRPGTAVHVPRGRLLQALSSLAKNAIEALEGEGVVTLRSSSPRRDWVALTVVDNGYGMNAEEIRQALLPMVSTKKDDQHTGVGLPLAQKIIKRECRGEFDIDSVPEQGTKVICLLPESPTP